jgi:hypothetical protein
MRIAALLSILACVACSSVTLDPMKKEFWVGGTIDKTDRARYARADSLDVTADSSTRVYTDCATAYGLARARTTAVPVDIADAAGGACEPFLRATLAAKQEAYDLRIAAAHLTPANELRAVDRRNLEIGRLTASLKERGRQAAMRGVIDGRP